MLEGQKGFQIEESLNGPHHVRMFNELLILRETIRITVLHR